MCGMQLFLRASVSPVIVWRFPGNGYLVPLLTRWSYVFFCTNQLIPSAQHSTLSHVTGLFIVGVLKKSYRFITGRHCIWSTSRECFGLDIKRPSVTKILTDQREDQSSASLAFVRGIHRWPVNSPHKGPVTWKMIPFDDVIMKLWGTFWWVNS